MYKRQITPTQLSLYSRSPDLGAWWDELDAQGLFDGKRPEPTPLDNQLFTDGLRHEKELVLNLKKQGFRIAELNGKQIESDYLGTKKAMAEGFDFIWQASLQNEEMRGCADLLRKIEGSSPFGNWSYIPIECKLSSSIKTTFLVQACAYCELLTPILGELPSRFELYLGGGKFEQFATEKFWAWYQLLRTRYRNFRQGFNPVAIPENVPGDHGRWSEFLDEKLKESRDLMLVANIRQTQRLKLKKAGIQTIDELANSSDDIHISGLSRESFHQLLDQAKLQTKSKKEDGKPHYILRKIVEGKGLTILPKENEGDIWFDLEGVQDPVHGDQLEYLIGAAYRDVNSFEEPYAYKDWWAHSRKEEKKMFENWVEWVQVRRRQYENLKIYHYGNYEKSAIRRLSQQYSTKEEIVDEWLRSELLVDLLPVVTGAIVLGEDSYSIKKVEKLYMDSREADVATACDSVVAYRKWEASNEPSIPGVAPDGSPQLNAIKKYNRDDCISTVLLHNWLLERRNEQGLPDEPLGILVENKESKKANPLEILRDELIEELPEDLKLFPKKGVIEKNSTIDDLGCRGMSWGVQRILAHLLPFHHREAKVSWWSYFDRKKKAALNPDELQEDNEAIEGAIWKSKYSKESKRTGADYHTFKFDPSQDLKLYRGTGEAARLTLEIASTGLKLDVDKLDVERGEVTLKYPWSKKNKRRKEGLSEGLPDSSCTLLNLPADIAKPLRDRLEEQAQRWVYKEEPLPKAFQQLLERQSVDGLSVLNELVKDSPKQLPILLADFLVDHSSKTIALQGPPGTGKSTVTAKLIAELLKRDKRIAISSNSNPAINNLLVKTRAICDQYDLDEQIVKCTSQKEDSQLSNYGIPLIPPAVIANEMTVVGGTTWSFSREEMSDQFDVLVIDEAGQMSMANLLVMARCAKSILLVGDQQQLSQPTKASHPGESGDSCLEYLIKGANVVPKDKGIFLSRSWRMEPSITKMVSQLFYDKQLKANPQNKLNVIEWNHPCLKTSGEIFPNAGLVFDAVNHQGRSVRCDEEINKIEKIVDALLGGTYRYSQTEGVKSGVITAKDILVTAPYNVQVNKLQDRLKGKAKVGTVDKFQGQEAPIAIHSLTASSGNDAPRGISFLLEPNRLNVAVSRAQCLSIVVGSTGLAIGLINTVEEAEQVNRLCRIMDTTTR